MHHALVGQTPVFKHLHRHGVQQMSRVANTAELAPFLLSDRCFNALWDEQGPEKQQRHGVSSQGSCSCPVTGAVMLIVTVPLSCSY